MPRERGACITAPCGSWKSPISSELIVRGTVGLAQPTFDGDDILFTEMRPSEKGRNVLIRRAKGGASEEVVPAGFNVRTRVHEYGGGDYLADQGVTYFSNFADQRVYRHASGAEPTPLTPTLVGGALLRFADYQLDGSRRRLVCVREDKRLVESREDVNTIVALDLDGNETEGRVLAAGFDFYASPRVSPDGSKLAWLCWNHPNMPWDAAELWIGSFGGDGGIANAVRIAGGDGESVFQPEWSPDGTLYFVSDRTDFGNLYRLRDRGIEAVCPRDAEFGLPQWVFGLSTYAFVGQDVVLSAFAERGIWRIATIDVGSGTLSPIDSPYTWFSGIRTSAPAGQAVRALFLAASPTEPSSVVELDVANGRFEVLRRSTDLSFDREDLSIPEAIEFPTEKGLSAHAFYYRPNNADHSIPPDELPPLIVKSHGGPTGATSSSFSLAIQYWTSRGFAVVDVNYGGSTGYGRRYRERLLGQWGIVDVDDCVNAARYLVAKREVDCARLAITGGSAGGYTTLSALTFRNVFSAGASHFGISDLERLAHDARTGNHHKFESRYEDRLVAPYPEQVEIYRQRSPIHFAENLSCPVIFFQGLEDRIVLPNQAERMVQVLREKHLPVAYVPFEGEGHGFRRAEHIKRALDAELYFYSRVFHFEPADPIEPVTIENLPSKPSTGKST